MSCQHVWERRDKQPWCLPYYICKECEMGLSTSQYDAVQQAHRAGWEQAKREAVGITDKIGFAAHSRTDAQNCCAEIADAIASMEYKGAEND